MAELAGLSYPTTANAALYQVSKASNWFCSFLLPEWMVASDRVYHHHTNSAQSYSELLSTMVIYYISIFVLTTLVDFGIMRPLTFALCKATGSPTKNFTRTSWYLLHAVFNALVVVTSWDEALEVFLRPMERGFDPPRWWGSHPGSLFGAIAIGAFHLHHFAFYTTTTEDIVHHVVNAGLVVVIGSLCPWGRFTALSNFAMCGFPGGVSYFALWLQKLGIVSRMGQKKLNRFLNLCIRYPIQACVHYLMFITVVRGTTVPEIDTATGATMFIGALAHTMNSLYYANEVVSNYAVERHIQRNGGGGGNSAKKDQ